jgi:molybdate transport system regulatory protein
MKRVAPELELRPRVSRQGRHLFGPGKAELLHYILVGGSIRTAASEMHMSYHRAWSLVQQMNALFTKPLVAVSRGGGSGGGATLTATGRKVLLLYARLDRACLTKARPHWLALRDLLR